MVGCGVSGVLVLDIRDPTRTLENPHPTIQDCSRTCLRVIGSCCVATVQPVAVVGDGCKRAEHSCMGLTLVRRVTDVGCWPWGPVVECPLYRLVVWCRPVPHSAACMPMTPPHLQLCTSPRTTTDHGLSSASMHADGRRQLSPLCVAAVWIVYFGSVARTTTALHT